MITKRLGADAIAKVVIVEISLGAISIFHRTNG
jgi:hypothetical protein